MAALELALDLLLVQVLELAQVQLGLWPEQRLKMEQLQLWQKLGLWRSSLGGLFVL